MRPQEYQFHRSEAYKRFLEEKKRKSTLAYLSQNIGKVPDMIAATEHIADSGCVRFGLSYERASIA